MRIFRLLLLNMYIRRLERNLFIAMGSILTESSLIPPRNITGKKSESDITWEHLFHYILLHLDFLKISKPLQWIIGIIYDSCENNPYLKREYTLELKFISAAPKIIGKGYYLAVYFIRLP